MPTGVASEVCKTGQKYYKYNYYNNKSHFQAIQARVE